MRPFFLLTMPRCGGTALARMLDATPGIRCAGESHELLPLLRKLEDLPRAVRPGDSWGRHAGSPAGWEMPGDDLLVKWSQPDMVTTDYGVRSTFTGHDGWEDACDAWSWLLERWPCARLVFVVRDEDDGYELSLFSTAPLWVPAFGSCHGNVLARTRAQRQAMQDFHEMNPARTVLVTMAEIFDHEALTATLEPSGLSVCPRAWARVAMERPGDRRLIAAEMSALIEIKGAEEDGPDFSADELPADPDFDAAMLADLEKPAARGGWRKNGLPDPLRLPVPPASPRGTVEVHTLRFGNAPWLVECGKTLEGWCGRHGMALRTWNGAEEPGLPHPKFAVVGMLWAFLAGEADRMVYVDADVFVHPAAPAFPAGEGLTIMEDLPFQGKLHTEWLDWCGRHFPELDTTGWTYRNAGVWSIDRPAAERLLEVMREPYLPAVMEQHHFNAWLVEAHAAGMEVRSLPEAWNCFASQERAAWFHHLAGRGNKMKKLKRLRQLRLLPPPPEGFQEIESTGPRAICYLWTKEKARWDELRYSLRAMLAHGPADVPIHIFADDQPEWLADHPRVTVHNALEYATALSGAVQIAEEVLLMNDDIYLLQPAEWEDFGMALTRPGNLIDRMVEDLGCSRKWRRSVGRAALSLHHHGFNRVADFSTHTPYLFKREQALATLRRHGCWWKIPFETLYHNDHGTPRRKCGRDKVMQLPAPPSARFLNHGGPGPDATTRAELRRLFPDPAPWEIIS